MRARFLVWFVAVGLFGYTLVSAPYLPMRASLMLGSSAVGISAAVPSNPYSALAQELVEREAELARREALVREAENRSWIFNESLAPYSFGLSIVLFLLLAFNYYLDWRRGRRGYTVSA